MEYIESFIEIVIDYIEGVFGFSGQIAIIGSIVASVICLVIIPQDIRQRIIFHINRHKRTITYKISGKLDSNNEFIITSKKRNKRVLDKYFEETYDKIYLNILDYRKYIMIKNSMINSVFRRQKMLKLGLNKIKNECTECNKAVQSLFLDKSAINSEAFRWKYNYTDLIKSIVEYCVNERREKKDTYKIKFFYLKTNRNNLPHDIEMDVVIDDDFLRKYSPKIDELYFDISRIKEYIEKFNLQKEDVEFAYNAIEFYKRNNMDIYDLEVNDFIKYIAPVFYVYIGTIRDGEWVYSNLDNTYYYIDHFEFDLSALYELCKEKNLIKIEVI